MNRLYPKPLPGIRPLPEYLATGERKRWYEAMKGGHAGAVDGRRDHGLRALPHFLQSVLGGRAAFSGATRDALLDERGRPWKVAEEALLGPEDERLAHIPGVLAYWFGWYSFFPKTEPYGAIAVGH